MSARERGRPRRTRATGRAPAPRAPRRRARPLRRWVGAGAAAVLAGAVLAWWLLPPRREAPRDPRATVPSSAAAESATRAIAAEDWAASLYWADLLAAREPRNSRLMLNLAMASNNFAFGGHRSARARDATRSSLERARIERRAFALLDSAAALTGDARESAYILEWRGQLYEVLGLPLEALVVYGGALERFPDSPEARTRMGLLYSALDVPPARGGARP